MKKISLKSIKSEELLSKEELKQIVGGVLGSGGGEGIWTCTATSPVSGTVTSSANSTDSTAMAYLDNWASFWDTYGSDLNCTFTPIYHA